MEFTRAQSSGSLSPQGRFAPQDLHNRKRHRSNSETAVIPQKRRCKRTELHPRLGRVLDCAQVPFLFHLPSPTSSPSVQSPTSITRKRKPSFRQPLLERAQSAHPVDQWLSTLPNSDKFETYNNHEKFDAMSRPPSKRSRSTDSVAGRSSGDGSDTVASREKKYAVYKDVNYPKVLETKGSFMKSSKLGIIAQDKEFCDKLFSNPQPIPQDDLFSDELFSEFHSTLRGRSEARICVDLHPRVMPSVENLCVRGQRQFESLVEGHNDPWIKSVLFYGPRPQPDHTIGFKWSVFTDEQRRKLNIEATKKSCYTAREDIYFPFFTGEVKCGRQALSLADASNANSMTVFQQGIVHLYSQLNRAAELHRRILGFSISHDDNNIHIYAHYPEIDGDKTTYWRETLNVFSFEHNRGKDRWKCYQFALNVCELFAPLLLERLIEVIDKLPDSTVQCFDLTTTFDDVSVQSSQEDTSVAESPEERFKRPTSTRGLNAELRNIIQAQQEREKQLSTQLEQALTILKQQGDRFNEQSDQMKQLLENR